MKRVKITKWPFIAVAFALILSISGISAYLTDGERIENQTVVGGNRIEVVEEFTPPDEVKPGTVIHKDVKVKNTGHSDCYTRILIVFSDCEMEKHCTVDWNTEDFVYDNTDGYYYYPGVLKEGEMTPSLITTIQVSETADMDEVVPFHVIVYAESYQANGFSDYRSAWQHFERNKE